MERLCWFVRASACDRHRSQRVPGSTWLQQPEFKTFPPGFPTLSLPSLRACTLAQSRPSSLPLISSLCHAQEDAGAAKTATAAPLSLVHISLLLQLSFGITGDHSYKRAAPSSGGLCPSELYVFWANALYHFSPDAASLTQLRPALPANASALHSLLPQAQLSSCTLFVVCNLHRTGTKYGDRCFRYVAADVGHILENARLVALALGLNCIVQSAFDDAEAAALLGVDGVGDIVLAVASVGCGAPAAADTAAFAHSGVSAVDAGHFVACSESQSASDTLGVTGIAHAISSLRRAPSNPSSAPSSPAQASRPFAPIAPSSSATSSSPSAAASAISLPPPASPPASIFDCILSRRSFRKNSPGAVPPDALHALLLAILTPAHCVSSSVRLHVVANRAGISPAVYRAAATPTRRIQLSIVKCGAFAAAAQEAALGQDVIGGAAIVLIFSLSRPCIAAAAAAGREYRNGYIEAGARGRCARFHHRTSVANVTCFVRDDGPARAALCSSSWAAWAACRRVLRRIDVAIGRRGAGGGVAGALRRSISSVTYETRALGRLQAYVRRAEACGDRSHLSANRRC